MGKVAATHIEHSEGETDSDLQEAMQWPVSGALALQERARAAGRHSDVAGKIVTPVTVP